MHIDNPIIVLIAIYSLRNDNDINTFKQLQGFLPLEKSQISQSLSHNEKKEFIKKPDEHRYFTDIQITPSGIRQAERYINFFKKLLDNLESPPEYMEKGASRDPHIPRNFKAFLDIFTTKFYSPLKRSIKNSLREYIPESHLSDNLLDDITDNVLNFFHDQLSSLFR